MCASHEWVGWGAAKIKRARENVQNFGVHFGPLCRHPLAQASGLGMDDDLFLPSPEEVLQLGDRKRCVHHDDCLYLRDGLVRRLRLSPSPLRKSLRVRALVHASRKTNRWYSMELRWDGARRACGLCGCTQR